MLKVVVLVSGGGTNLQAILDAVDSGAITNTEIVGVISNNKNAYALQRAEEKGIPDVCVSPKAFASRAEFNPVSYTHLVHLGDTYFLCDRRSRPRHTPVQNIHVSSSV